MSVVMERPRAPARGRTTKPLAPKSDFVSVWPASRGPDRSTLQVSVPVEHSKSNVDYQPAREIPEPPKKSSGRSSCFYLDPIDFLVKEAEGQLEMNASLRYLADRFAIRLHPQFGPVFYVNADGKRTWTVFDQRVSYQDGTNTVVSVKPRGRAAKLGTDALNRLIFDQMPVRDADRVQLITEEDLPQWALANFRLFHSVRNDGHWLHRKEMARAAAAVLEPISVDQFAKPWGGAASVFRTVAMLIFQGVLRQVNPGEIDETTMVVANNKEKTNEHQS